MNCPKYLITELEASFTKIQHERMADVPVLNPALQVQAVGFRKWQAHCLGILITPWFMNLMLLRNEGDEWLEQPSGSKNVHVFPSGDYEFIVGEESSIGHYQMCSLFSPVFEFENQQAAVATAEAVLEGIMDEANRDDVSTRESEIQKIWNGEQVAIEAGAEPGDENRPTLSERFEKPMTRREMLRGAFLNGEVRREKRE